MPPDADFDNMTRRKAAGLLKIYNPNAAWRNQRTTANQDSFLRRHGLDRPNLTRGEASDIIGRAAEASQLFPGLLATLANTPLLVDKATLAYLRGTGPRPEHWK